MQSQIPASEYNALVDLYNATAGPSWRFQNGWLNPQAMGWYGVPITSGHVSALNLDEINLKGSIPASLTNLSRLQHLNLEGNQLSGSIPANLASLTLLQGIDLGNNQLSGGIPPSLGDLTNLVYLELDGNQLSGSIPDTVGNIFWMQTLYLDDNQLSGSIPASLSDLPVLTSLVLADNKLSGQIPDLSPAPIYVLDLSGNQLSGSIPASLGKLSRLETLSLAFNHLGGIIPTNLGNIAQLEELDLQGNQLSGDVPDFTTFTNTIFYTFTLNLYSNYLNIAAGSQSLSNIDAMSSNYIVVYLPQNASPTLGPISFSGGAAQIAMTAEPGSYAIQTSSDLENWITLTNLAVTNSSAAFLDSTVTNQPRRFYRTLNPP